MIDKHALVHENSAVLHKTAIQRAQIGFTNQKSLRSPFEPIVRVNTPQSVSFSLVCEHYYWIHSGTVSQANTGHVQQDPSQVFLGFELLDLELRLGKFMLQKCLLQGDSILQLRQIKITFVLQFVNESNRLLQ